MSTTGKIFQDSNNIYEDQARLLFSFYEQAAQRIVRQEEQLEAEIEQLEADRATAEEQYNKAWLWLLTIVLFFMYFVRRSTYGKQLEAIDAKIAEKKTAHDHIFRDYKVTKMGVAYVPVAKQVPFEEKSIIVDYTGQTAPSEITVQKARQNDLLVETIAQMEQLTKEAPIVESSDEVETVDTNDYSRSIQELNQSDYIGKLDRSLRTISYCMNDTEVKSVELPLVHDHSDYLQVLNEYTTTSTDKHPVLEAFNTHQYDQQIESFSQINQLRNSLARDTEQFEDVLRHLMQSMAMSVQTVSAMKLASTQQVVGSSNDLLLRLLKAPYNHYSPLLESEEIQRIRHERFDYADAVNGYQPFLLRESSRVRYNLYADEWVAEDNSQAPVPFGVHQIYEEIVAPIVQRLMEENRVERIRIYGQIHSEKLNYLNKWHQDVDAFYRSNHAESADIINNMQHTLSEYVEAFNTLAQLQKTLDSMGAEDATLDSTVVEQQDTAAETLMAFEQQANEFKQVQEDFASYMDRLQEDILLKAERFGHVEFYDARLQDGYSNAVAVAASEVGQLDDRRRPLALSNPLLAKEAVLLPSPHVEGLAYEHLSLNLPSIAFNALQQIHNVAPLPDNNNEVTATVAEPSSNSSEDSAQQQPTPPSSSL